MKITMKEMALMLTGTHMEDMVKKMWQQNGFEEEVEISRAMFTWTKFLCDTAEQIAQRLDHEITRLDVESKNKDIVIDRKKSEIEDLKKQVELKDKYIGDLGDMIARLQK